MIFILKFLEFLSVKLANNFLFIFLDDPDVNKKSALSHRKYFQEHGSFKPIANINDTEVLKAIHWNFRLLYLRDYILGHYLDEKILHFISTVNLLFDLKKSC